MDTSGTDYKRKKLIRSYQLVIEYFCINKGYTQNDTLPSKISYVKKFLEYQFLSHYFIDVPLWRKYLRKLSSKRTLPDFCVMGPIKSGTSDLAVNLLLHPNIMPPLSKEFYLSDPEEWRIYYPTRKQKQKYAERYGQALSPYLAPFLDWMELTYNLSQIQPDTKIVLVLRDPVKRFYSHWKWEVLTSGKKRAEMLPFLSSFASFVDQAIAMFPEYPMYTVNIGDPLRIGMYWKAVNYWIECFGRENILVLDVADYFYDKNQFLGQIYEFVGLPNFECPTYSDKINENPIILPPADQDSIHKLINFYEPYNQKLWAVLGKKFNWG